jgi:hypothetical protein
MRQKQKNHYKVYREIFTILVNLDIKEISHQFFNAVWNELPKEIREARSLNCFKAGLDEMKLFKT